MSRVCIYLTHGSRSIVRGVAKVQRETHRGEIQVVAVLKDGLYVVEPHKERYTTDDFLEFLGSLGSIYRLCCDANLENPMHITETETVRNMVSQLMPQELVLFSSTPECVNHVNTIFFKEHLPGVERAIAISHAQLGETLRNPIPQLGSKIKPPHLETDLRVDEQVEKNELPIESKGQVSEVKRQSSSVGCFKGCLQRFFPSPKVADYQPDKSEKDESVQYSVTRKTTTRR